MDACPPDMAKMTFYDFIKSLLGADLWAMLALAGPLNPDKWDVHNRWWLRQKEALQDRLGRRGDSSDWIRFVIWRSKLYMHTFLDLQKIVCINITLLPLEKIIWDFVMLRNILLELKLVAEEDLNKPNTYFQKVATMGESQMLYLYCCNNKNFQEPDC